MEAMNARRSAVEPAGSGAGWRRLRHYARLTRLDRPIGSLLLLWPTWWALWLAAGGLPDWDLLMIFTLGVLLTRSAGCAINDYFDRDFDGSVARTVERPLATGAITPREALDVACLLGVLAFGLVLFTNRLTILLSCAGALIAATYPLFKRFTYLPQAYLGIAFGWGIPMAFAAQTGGVPRVAWVLLIANLFWVVAYDTLYAMVDRPDDLRLGIKSSAILFGPLDRVAIGVMHLSALLTLLMVGDLLELNRWFHAGLLAALGIAFYHQWLIRERDRAACFRAFRHNNWFGCAVFGGIVLSLATGGAA